MRLDVWRIARYNSPARRGLLHRLRGSLSVILPLTLLAALYSLASAARSSLGKIKIAHIYAQPQYVDLPDAA
jgi:hypothetical protein